ncbi:MAG: hypothetical protein ACI4ET_12560, partial [Bilifractor sp.]
MLFYKIIFSGKYEPDHLEDDEEKKIREVKLSLEDRNDICSATADFNARQAGRCCFVSEIKKEKITVCLSSEEKMDPDFIRTFLQEAGFKIDGDTPKSEEITFREAKHMANRAESHHWISDTSEIPWMEDIDVYGPRFQEEIITDSRLSSDQNFSYMSASLSEELERIHQIGKQKYFYGHPVHYLICTDSEEFCQHVCFTLVKALYDA